MYELRADGFYLNGVNQDGGLGEARTSSSVCKSNKKITSPPIQPSGTRRFILKASIHSIGLRSSIKSKVVHYKYKDGSWKKARARLAVSVRGAVRNTACAMLDCCKSKIKPETIGEYKKRRSLKVKVWDTGTIWKTFSGEVIGGFTNPEGYYANLSLTW